MKPITRLLCALALTVLFCIGVYADEFSRMVSITGGSAQRLSNSLSVAGYTGPSLLDELTICNPSGSTVYMGHNSGVNASNGFPLSVGSCITYRAASRPIDVTRIYLFVASTQNVAISLRSR